METGISGFPTAILATCGSGKPVIAVHTEYDALPGVSQEAGVTERKPVVPGAPGHAEGHNCGSALAMGALFAVMQAMDENKLPGTIKSNDRLRRIVASSRTLSPTSFHVCLSDGRACLPLLRIPRLCLIVGP